MDAFPIKSILSVACLALSGVTWAASSPPPAGQPEYQAIEYKPVEGIEFERTSYANGKALISGRVQTPESTLSSVTVNGVSIPVYENRFSGIVLQGSNNALVRARNESGGVAETSIQLGSPVSVHIGRAVKDGNLAKISGYVTSHSSELSQLTVDGEVIPVDAQGYFDSEILIAEDDFSVVITAENINGGKDYLTVDFSENAPVHGITLKLRESALQQVGEILEPVIDDLIPGLAGTLETTLDNLGGNGGDDFANGSYDIHSTSVSLISNSSIQLSPAPHDNKAGIHANIGLEQLAVSTTVYAKGCVFWVICPSVTIPVTAHINNPGVNGNLYVGKGIAEPADDAVFAKLDANLNLTIGNIAVPSAGALSGLVEWVVNLIAKPIIETEVSKLVGNLITTEVDKILVNTVPTKIPALLVDNDNGVSETLENIGILPLFKILVRGIGATIGVSDTFSTAQESTLAIDANLISNSVDRLVKFGYVKRDLPSSQTFLNSVQPTSGSPFDAVLIVDADMLNKTASVFNQASLMDFTIPAIDIDQLSPNAPELIRSSDIQMRVYSKNGSPYFGVPANDGDLLSLSMTDYMLELKVDGQVLLETHVDVTANADLKIRDNRFSIPLLNVNTHIRGAKLAGRDIALQDAGVNSLINSMSQLASAKVLKVMEILPLPVIPGNKIISIDTWRVGRSSADIALAVRLEDAATNSTTNTSVAINEGSSESTASESSAPAPGGISIPSELTDIINGIGGIFTVIGDEPLDQLPDQQYDVVDPNANKPQVPAINRQPIGVKDNQFTRPHMPDVRVSQDGRIGIGAFAGKLTVIKPEMLDEAFTTADPIVISDQAFDIGSIITSSDLVKGTVLAGGFSNNAICDPDVKYMPAGTKQNPYACGVDGRDDCYDFNVVASVITSYDKTFSQLVPILNQVQLQTEEEHLASVPVRIRVENPKTADARIVHGEVTGAPSISKPFSGMLFEMNSIMDGRLLVTRASGRALTWYNEAKDQYVTGNYDNVYAVFDEDTPPCDVSSFSDWKPLTHAPYDARVKDKYKFAAYPFRDPTGAYIPDGAEIKGTYPWISRDGSMVAFSAIGISRLFPKHHIDPSDTRQRYPSRCLDDEPECNDNTRADVQFRSLDSGIAMAGLWTQGKIILSDSLINEIDFKLGTGAGDKEHSLVALYEPNTGKNGNESGEIEVGETRQTSVAGGDGTKLGNGTIFDSTTNLLNANKHVLPVTPRDVVWTFNTGRQSDEVAFDDYLNPNGFIVSHMVGAMEHDNGNEVAMTYYDGWNQAALDFVNPVRVQNSATALPDVWNIPAYGEVHFGRLEPTATGGIRGKGLWTDGQQTYVSYAVGKQPKATINKPWFYALSVDPRFDNDDVVRTLIRFPDNTEITLLGTREIQYRRAGTVVNSIVLPQVMKPISWTNLAWQTREQGTKVSFFLNGMLYNSWATSDAIFQIQEGDIYLAGTPASENSQAGFRGWIDDFKAFSELTNPEVICNHAYGTLVGLPEGYEGELKATAMLYPPSAHSLISRITKGYGRETYPKYACYSDNSADYAAHLQNIPQGVEPMRESLIFPEGPLFHAKPRPDSLNNQFCLSCHHSEGKGGLGLSALALNTSFEAKHDPRRQPMQPPARIGGNLPANWLPQSETFDTKTPDEGAYVDELLMTSGDEVVPQVKGLTLVDATTGLDVMPIENGTVLNLEALPARLALRFVANGVTQNVSYGLNGSTGVLQSPFSIAGVTVQDNGERDFNVAGLVAGQYSVTASANVGEDLSFTFTAVGVSPEYVDNSVPDPVAIDEDTLFEQAVAVFDAVVDFFSGLLDSVKETIFGTTSDADAQSASAEQHRELWDQSERISSLQSLKPAQIYFPEVNKCATIWIGYGAWDADNGQNIYLDHCHGGANQLWHSDDSGRIFSMIDQHTAEAKRRCLDGTGMNNGNNVLIWDCHGGDNQKWRLTESNKIQGLVNTGACLGVDSDDNLVINNCDQNANNPYQKVEWREPQLTQFSTIKSEETGKCLAIVEDIVPSAFIGQKACNYNDDRQMWQYNPISGRLHSKVRGAYCAGVAENGNTVQIQVCNDSLVQKWNISNDGRLFNDSYQGRALSTIDTQDLARMSSDVAANDARWNVQTGQDIQIINTNNRRCMEMGGNPVAGVAVRQAGHCTQDGEWSWNQRWKYDRASGEIRNALSPYLCVTVNGAASESQNLTMEHCNGSENQSFDYMDGHISLRWDPNYDLAIRGVNTHDPVAIAPRTNRTYHSWSIQQVMKSGNGFVPTTAPQRIKVANGRCLDFSGNVPYNNNPAIVYDCVGGNWQQWHFEGDLLRSTANPEFCLSYNHNNILGINHAVVTRECTGHVIQQWTRTDAGLFRSKAAPQMCLDTANMNPQNQDAVVLKQCKDIEIGRQQWTPSAELEIKGSNGRCMDFEGTEPANAKRVITWDCGGQQWQKWMLSSSGHIRSVRNPNFCVDIDGSQPYENSPLNTWQCADIEWQKWTKDENGLLRNRQDPSFCIDTVSANPQNGTQMVLKKCINVQQQSWAIN